MFEQFIVEFLEEKPSKRKLSDEVTFSFSSIYLFHYYTFLSFSSFTFCLTSFVFICYRVLNLILLDVSGHSSYDKAKIYS